MLNLASRVKRLEHSRGLSNAQRCPECGRLPDGRFPEDGSTRLSVVMAADPYDGGCSPEFCVTAADGDGPPIPEFCTSCGGRRIYCLEFDKPGDHEDSLASH